MTIESFVRASGAVMGNARESLGPGGPAPLTFGNVGTPPAAPVSSGRAAESSAADSVRVDGDVSMLGEHDRDGHQQVSDAVSSAAAGRDGVDQIIAAAIADVERLGQSTDTDTGKQALVDAIKGRLHDTASVLDTASADAGTRAAGARTRAASYQGVGVPASTAPAAMMGMPTMPSAPTQGLSGLGGLIGGLPALAMAGRNVGTAAPQSAQTAVRRDGRDPVVPGTPNPPVRGDRRSVARYIYDAARARRYSPDEALAITSYAAGESNFDPGVTPAPQYGSEGGSADENTVVGEFQEKPGFARAGGIDPAQRYTVEGNTQAYLNNLEHHRNDPGDIIDHLVATSVGGPGYTGGRSKMAQLMASTRRLLEGTET